jgi:hypothetical protein
MGFEVLTASMKMSVFRDVRLCNLVGIDQRFGGAYCLLHQGDSLWWSSALVR